MKIVKLVSSNFKRLVAVEIEPAEDGSLVLVTGKNGMGKSSVLDVIYTTLGGGKIAPDKPIRDGQEKAENTIITENYTITRTFTEKGSKLVIKNAEGFAASSPQKLLDKIVGDLSFDPMEFIRMGNTEAGKKLQRSVLMQLAGLDYSDIDADITKAKSDRSDVRRDKERYEHEAERIVVAEGTPDEEVNLSDVVKKLNDANEHNQNQGKAECRIDGRLANVKQCEADRRQIESVIKRVESELEKAKADLVGSVEIQTCLEKEIDAITDTLEPLIDVGEINGSINSLEKTNDAVRQKLQKANLVTQAEAEAEKYRKLGKKMKDLEQAKAASLANTTMPLEGLSVTDDCVVYGNIPLSQVNGAKQLEVGLGIAMAQNPELKVILMNGNDLDKDSLDVISKMTKDKGFQVWIERIEGAGGIVIEDGMVKQ